MPCVENSFVQLASMSCPMIFICDNITCQLSSIVYSVMMSSFSMCSATSQVCIKVSLCFFIC